MRLAVPGNPEMPAPSHSGGAVVSFWAVPEIPPFPSNLKGVVCVVWLAVLEEFAVQITSCSFGGPWGSWKREK